jgi:hypothetical protein
VVIKSVHSAPKGRAVLFFEKGFGRTEQRIFVARISVLTIANLKQVAEIRRFFVEGNFGEGLFALLGHGLVKVPAVKTGSQFSSALRTLITSAHLARDHLKHSSTFSAARHGPCITDLTFMKSWR